MKGKRIREKGKVRLSRYFKKFKTGERVGVVKALEVRAGFPKRIIGKTGKIKDMRGSYYLAEINITVGRQD